MDCINGLLKWDIEEIRYAYEELFESGKVDVEAIYPKDLPPEHEKLSKGVTLLKEESMKNNMQVWERL